MIEFRCRSCGRTFSVPDNRGGQKGKCPGCGNIMMVPARTESLFLFDQKELSCKSPELQGLYDSITTALGPRIVQHRINDDGDLLIFEVATSAGRTQLVCAVESYDERLEKKRLLIYSQIGTLVNSESAVAVLRAADIHRSINFAIDEDFLLSAALTTDLDEAASKLWLEFMLVAIAADAMEDLLFGWDLK